METNEILVRKTDSDATAEVLSALSKTEKGKNNIIKFENCSLSFSAARTRFMAIFARYITRTVINMCTFP